MPIISDAVESYLAEWATSDDPIIAEMEALAAEIDFPIVGPQVGRLLYLLATTAGARRVFELGSGFGYSAHWFARAVGSDGHVVLTDFTEERCARADDFLSRAGLRGWVSIEAGDAVGHLRRIGGKWDILFNDIDKAGYPEVFELALEYLSPGGLLISDNMLWSGRVADQSAQDPATKGIRELTRRLYESDQFDCSLLPVRDGVIVARRR